MVSKERRKIELVSRDSNEFLGQILYFSGECHKYGRYCWGLVALKIVHSGKEKRPDKFVRFFCGRISCEIQSYVYVCFVGYWNFASL